MKKQTVLVSINKKDGSLKFETHGVKGKACVEMLEELLGELVDISDSELKDDYYDDNDVHVTTESESEIEVGDKE
jgi:hypothetical protein